MQLTTTFYLRYLTRLGLLLALLLLFTFPNGHSLAQSFPTFTPTPGPATNTPVPPPATNTPVPPLATNTPVPPLPATNTPVPPPPGSTATPTAVIPPTQTTAPGVTVTAVSPLPTAEPCSPNPTLLTLTAVAVHEGPGADYPLLGQLTAGQVYWLTGRAAAATWWVIELADGAEGWVFDATTAVSIQGDISQLPIVNAPLLGNNTPTPGPTWQPTPNAICLTPTATMAAQTPAPAGDATRQITAMAETDGAVAEEETEMEETAVDPDTANQNQQAAPITGSAPTPAPLPTDPAQASSDWLPLIGMTLVLMGIIAALIMRRL